MAARDHVLMFTLGAIVLINIIAIVLLNNRIAEQETLAQTRPAPAGTQQAPQAPVVIRTQPAVRTLVLEDKQRCPDCFDVGLYIAVLNDTVNMQVERVPAAGIAQFKSGILPALAFNKTLAQYSALVEGWEQAGHVINISEGPYAGEWYVLPSHNAPYYAINDSRVRGRVTVTYITMESCEECYDVYLNREFLNATRIVPHRELTIDVESREGRALLAKYNITAVPTILLDREAGEYTNLRPGWSVVGTVEPDGTHVLRDLQRLEVVYYDLAAKKLMKP